MVVVVGGRGECVILTDKMLWLSCFLSLKSVLELEGVGGGGGILFRTLFPIIKECSRTEKQNKTTATTTKKKKKKKKVLQIEF